MQKKKLICTPMLYHTCQIECPLRPLFKPHNPKPCPQILSHSHHSQPSYATQTKAFVVMCPPSHHIVGKVYVLDSVAYLSPHGGQSIVKLNTTCEQSLLPIYYMPCIIFKFMIFFLHIHNH